jgi:hypothetical protein
MINVVKSLPRLEDLTLWTSLENASDLNTHKPLCHQNTEFLSITFMPWKSQVLGSHTGTEEETIQEYLYELSIVHICTQSFKQTKNVRDPNLGMKMSDFHISVNIRKVLFVCLLVLFQLPSRDSYHKLLR